LRDRRLRSASATCILLLALSILLATFPGCAPARKKPEKPIDIAVSPSPGANNGSGVLTLHFGEDIRSAQITALLSPLGIQAPANAVVGKQSITFEFNGPTYPVPATASVAGTVTLSSGRARSVAKTWSFAYMPAGVDDPLPPSAVLLAGSDEEFVYVYRETALLAAPDHAASKLAVLPVGAVLSVCAREGDWVQVTVPSPPDLPAFRDRSGRTPPASISPGLTGWAPAGALTTLVAPACDGMGFAGDTARHKLEVLYRGYPAFGATITGEVSKDDLRCAEAIACVSLLSLYSDPHTWGVEIDEATKTHFSAALAEYAKTALNVERFPVLANMAECAEIRRLLQESAELNQTLLQLRCPLTAAAARERLGELISRSTGFPTKISDDLSISNAIDSWREQWLKLRNGLISKLSESIRPYSPGD